MISEGSCCNCSLKLFSQLKNAGGAVSKRQTVGASRFIGDWFIHRSNSNAKKAS